jgi:hypothetical protein
MRIEVVVSENSIECLCVSWQDFDEAIGFVQSQ